jgi:asparaginyl-tRNA synthetase
MNQIGPYKTIGRKLAYVGNKIFSPIPEVRKILPPDMSRRHMEIGERAEVWAALMRIWDCVHQASAEFMKTRKILFFDLPIITRMISSPGALKGTIISDVDPFRLRFFDKETFLTQSSQLYLEFAITNPQVKGVYCWDKSFRREHADFRHLPEFAHIEFEGNIGFSANLKMQKGYLQHLIASLVQNNAKDLKVFLIGSDISALKAFAAAKSFPVVTFEKAFALLKKATGERKYDKATIGNFSAFEEVLLTEIIGGPVFVTEYIGEEVAFYHAPLKRGSKYVRNADLLFPGYGEIIGSGERVHTRKETYEKARHFRLDMEDYRPYIDSRSAHGVKTHSGWGMGVERFIQTVLKLPYIWEAKAFPRIDGQNRP